jgi:uncharacterized membrane protein (UPF0127 family)
VITGPRGARRAVLVAFAAAALAVGCSSATTADPSDPPASEAASATSTGTPLVAPEGFPTGTLTVTRPDGSVEQLTVHVADTPALRQQGLMDVTDPGLGGLDAMVFVFAGETTSAFWMKDTLLPLSIAWFRADGTYVDQADMDPCPEGTQCPTFGASGAYRYAVEVPLGGLDALGLVEGSTIALTTG